MAATSTTAGLGKPIVDAGGAVLEILATDGFVVTPAPTQQQLDAWVNAHNLNVSSFIDAPDTPTRVSTLLGGVAGREIAIIFAVPSMQIVWVDHGDQTGISPSSINAAATEMHMLLGK